MCRWDGTPFCTPCLGLLQEPLAEVRCLCWQLGSFRLHSVAVGQTYSLPAFMAAQQQQLVQATQQLQEFEDSAVEAVVVACTAALAALQARLAELSFNQVPAHKRTLTEWYAHPWCSH
jgi:hypothetical protein